MPDQIAAADSPYLFGPLQVLIIDEISMVSAELFHQLEHHARMIRGVQEPFGGVQIVLSGDYFQ